MVSGMVFFGRVGRLLGRVADVRKKLAGTKDDRKTEQDGSTSRLPLARRTSNHSFDGVDRGQDGVRDTQMEPSERHRERGQVVFCQGILGVPKPDGVAKRYFVLTHDQLKYYATKEKYYRGEQPRGFILLHEVIDIDFVDDTLHVKVDGTDRPVLFIPDPLEDIPTWLEAFAEVLATQQHPDGARLSEKMSVRGAGALAHSPTLALRRAFQQIAPLLSCAEACTPLQLSDAVGGNVDDMLRALGSLSNKLALCRSGHAASLAPEPSAAVAAAPSRSLHDRPASMKVLAKVLETEVLEEAEGQTFEFHLQAEEPNLDFGGAIRCASVSDFRFR